MTRQRRRVGRRQQRRRRQQQGNPLQLGPVGPSPLPSRPSETRGPLPRLGLSRDWLCARARVRATILLRELCGGCAPRRTSFSPLLRAIAGERSGVAAAAPTSGARRGVDAACASLSDGPAKCLRIPLPGALRFAASGGPRARAAGPRQKEAQPLSSHWGRGAPDGGASRAHRLGVSSSWGHKSPGRGPKPGPL